MIVDSLFTVDFGVMLTFCFDNLLGEFWVYGCVLLVVTVIVLHCLLLVDLLLWVVSWCLVLVWLL